MLVWKYQSISKVMLVPVEEIYELGRIIKSLRSQLSQSLAQVFAMRTVSTETVINPKRGFWMFDSFFFFFFFSVSSDSKF